jgi:hypothetical protein
VYGWLVVEVLERRIAELRCAAEARRVARRTSLDHRSKTRRGDRRSIRGWSAPTPDFSRAWPYEWTGGGIRR